MSLAGLPKRKRRKVPRYYPIYWAPLPVSIAGQNALKFRRNGVTNPLRQNLLQMGLPPESTPIRLGKFPPQGLVLPDPSDLFERQFKGAELRPGLLKSLSAGPADDTENGHQGAAPPTPVDSNPQQELRDEVRLRRAVKRSRRTYYNTPQPVPQAAPVPTSSNKRPPSDKVAQQGVEDFINPERQTAVQNSGRTASLSRDKAAQTVPEEGSLPPPIKQKSRPAVLSRDKAQQLPLEDLISPSRPTPDRSRIATQPKDKRKQGEPGYDRPGINGETPQYAPWTGEEAHKRLLEEQPPTPSAATTRRTGEKGKEKVTRAEIEREEAENRRRQENEAAERARKVAEDLDLQEDIAMFEEQERRHANEDALEGEAIDIPPEEEEEGDGSFVENDSAIARVLQYDDGSIPAIESDPVIELSNTSDTFENEWLSNDVIEDTQLPYFDDGGEEILHEASGSAPSNLYGGQGLIQLPTELLIKAQHAVPEEQNEYQYVSNTPSSNSREEEGGLPFDFPYATVQGIQKEAQKRREEHLSIIEQERKQLEQERSGFRQEISSKKAATERKPRNDNDENEIRRRKERAVYEQGVRKRQKLHDKRRAFEERRDKLRSNRERIEGLLEQKERLVREAEKRLDNKRREEASAKSQQQQLKEVSSERGKDKGQKLGKERKKHKVVVEKKLREQAAEDLAKAKEDVRAVEKRVSVLDRGRQSVKRKLSQRQEERKPEKVRGSRFRAVKVTSLADNQPNPETVTGYSVLTKDVPEYKKRPAKIAKVDPLVAKRQAINERNAQIGREEATQRQKAYEESAPQRAKELEESRESARQKSLLAKLPKTKSTIPPTPEQALKSRQLFEIDQLRKEAKKAPNLTAQLRKENELALVQKNYGKAGPIIRHYSQLAPPATPQPTANRREPVFVRAAPSEGQGAENQYVYATTGRTREGESQADTELSEATFQKRLQEAKEKRKEKLKDFRESFGKNQERQRKKGESRKRREESEKEKQPPKSQAPPPAKKLRKQQQSTADSLNEQLRKEREKALKEYRQRTKENEKLKAKKSKRKEELSKQEKEEQSKSYKAFREKLATKTATREKKQKSAARTEERLDPRKAQDIFREKFAKKQKQEEARKRFKAKSQLAKALSKASALKPHLVKSKTYKTKVKKPARIRTLKDVIREEPAIGRPK